MTAKNVPGRFCVFIGYGTDTPGYRVLIPPTNQLKVYASVNVKVFRNVMPYRYFLTKFRVDPTYTAIQNIGLLKQNWKVMAACWMLLSALRMVHGNYARLF